MLASDWFVLHVVFGINCRVLDFFTKATLSKKLFPVCRVGKKTTSREFGISPPPPLIAFFFNWNVQWGGGSKKIMGGGGYEKKSSSRPFLAHSASGQEISFYLRMAQARLTSP